MLMRKYRQSKLFNLLVSVLSVFFLASCFNGITPPQARVALDPAGIATATYTRGPLSVNYSYKSYNDSLQISGEIQFQSAGDDLLNVRIEFLDQEGRVLSRQIIYSAGYRVMGMYASDRFDAAVKLPNGATAFAFSSSEKLRVGNK